MSSSLAPRSTHHLHEAVKSGATWGYVIYRTTYSPHSDAAFPQLIDQLTSCIQRDLFATPDLYKDSISATDLSSCNEIWAQYRPVIVAHQAQFDKASLTTIRSHFGSWIESLDQKSGPSLYRTCLVFDEESLQAFLNATVSSEKSSLQAIRFVKVLKAFEESEAYDAFLGGDYSSDTFDKRPDASFHTKGLALKDSESDDYDGFLGG